MREIFQLKSNTWETVSYGCQYCDRTFKTTKYCAKHEDECKAINTLKKQTDDDNVLVQRITKGSQTFYRRGNNGILRNSKEEAEDDTVTIKGR